VARKARPNNRRATVVVVGVSAVAVALFAGIAFFIANSARVPTLDQAHAPASAVASGGIPVGTAGVAGKDVPTNAVRVDIYQDFMCPYCAQFEQINAADIDTLRKAGTIAVYYHQISILDRYSAGTKYSTRSANAAAVVAARAPDRYLEFARALYSNQPAENSSGLSDPTIALLAAGAGVPKDVADSFVDGEFTKWVIAATDRASQDGVGGTPAMAVDGTVLTNDQMSVFFQAGALTEFLQGVADGKA